MHRLSKQIASGYLSILELRNSIEAVSNKLHPYAVSVFAWERHSSFQKKSKQKQKQQQQKHVIFETEHGSSRRRGSTLNH